MGAPWRKLWSSVSLSKKVNQLSDEAALFWTWAILYFSAHGFLKYDLDDLKNMIVPRRKSMTTEKIQGYVQQILKVKLWFAFLDKDGKVILYDPRWFEMQDIRRDRLGKPPYNIKEMTQIFTLLPDTPGLSRIVPECVPTPDYSRILPDTPGSGILPTTPAENRIEKNRIDKESTQIPKHQTVDNFSIDTKDTAETATSLKPEPNIQKTLFETLFPGKTSFVDALCISIISSDTTFNPYQWISMNKERNPDALIHSLKRLKDALQSKIGKSISSWPYIEAIIKDEDKNYNSREFDNRAGKDKSEFKTLVDSLKALQEKTRPPQY